jgi:hypothetical protein
MTSEDVAAGQPKTRGKAALDLMDRITKVSGFLAVAGAIIGAAYTQYLGPGLKSWSQDFTGVSAVLERLEFIEVHMPPPPVVDWNVSASGQVADCTAAECIVALNGSRTRYGETCGKPIDTAPFLRTQDGQSIQIEYVDFSPVELSRAPRTFAVPLKIPQFIQPGRHEFRVRVVYPHCPGMREPIPRWTPWIPLTVTEAPR